MPTPLPPPEGAPPSLHAPFLRLQSISIFVRNLERSLDFYVNALGFQLVFDARNRPGRPWAVVSPPDGYTNLVLAVPSRDSTDYKLIGRHTHIAFVTEDVMAKFREWRARGVQFTGTPRLKRLPQGTRVEPHSPSDPSTPQEQSPPIWGGVFSSFKDPDGNLFSLVSFDEVTNAVEAQRREQQARLEAEQRAAQEIEIAKQVQSRLFPQTLPKLATLDYAGICHQARQVGGDYYDFLSLGDTRLGLVIGDISGKGIAAALLMANLQANFRSQCAVHRDDPHRLLRSVNQLFCENTPNGSFATLFFAEYDDASRRLRYANCGHLCGLVLRADTSVESLHSTATILGAFHDWDCEVGESLLLPGDTFVLYTDGVTESFNPDLEEFGEARLVAALRRHHSLPPCELITAIVHEVRAHSPHEQHDDITLIAAKSH
ncbi:MAG TPA: SpoIIE family protein phosphatase [Candidatus Eisenbacteria bacterium]|nr:SpoIIE family protein phosphatase [Candidatus Eisenbacteria bacterium]